MHDIIRTALIVDDEPEIRDSIAAFFESRGWKAVTADDGSHALDLALASTPDVIVLDVMMPIQDGWETLRQLREDVRVGHIPIVMLTAVNDYELGMNYDADMAGRKAAVRPPESFIDKPLDIPTLLDAVTAIVTN